MKKNYNKTVNSFGNRTYYGWGRKLSGIEAVNKAYQYKGRYCLQEDGFIRSITRNGPPLSIVYDDMGIYYDANSVSRLEQLIQTTLTTEQQLRAQRLIYLWQQVGVSKYNSAREYAGDLPENYVLVIDQVLGDLSVSYGWADQTSFQAMLDAARRDNPNAQVIIKVHPDVFTKKKQGYFNLDQVNTLANVHIIAENCHPVRLIQHAKAIYTVTSQIGFEALIWGKPVYCFGMPFYAGWQLTHDFHPAPIRRSSASLEQLVYASLVAYPCYTSSETKQTCDVEDVISYIMDVRKKAHRFPAELYAFGFSAWKRKILPHYFCGSKIHFISNIQQLPEKSTLLVWGNQIIADLPKECQLLHVEDGFLRSVGLGVDMVFPLSWVVDQAGIYYDTTHPSDLEKILQTIQLDQAQYQRAVQLRQLIIDAQISKYNLPGIAWLRANKTQTVILVPGQVEDDASLQFGSPHIKSNLALLTLVRQQNPSAFIIYKPHPDVVSGIRHGSLPRATICNLCDEVLEHGDIVQLLSQVDEVHTMTSLSGFEALLRGVSVTCYGHPFYSGWGLTNDYFPFPRKKRALLIEELVAGCLIEYPLYLHKKSHGYVSPETIVNYLVEWKQTGTTKISHYRKVVRYFFRWYKKINSIQSLCFFKG